MRCLRDLLLAFSLVLTTAQAEQAERSEVQTVRASAVRGDAGAQYKLGLMYEAGVLVALDFSEAARWYRKAADQGFVRAQKNLGFMYEFGQGVPQDYASAHMWINLAASVSKGDEYRRLCAWRDRISARMTPAQIAEAHRMARKWKLK